MRGATAIHVITSSTDHYNYCALCRLNTESLTKYIFEQMGDEANYIDEVYATTDEGETVKFDYDACDPEY